MTKFILTVEIDAEDMMAAMDVAARLPDNFLPSSNWAGIEWYDLREQGSDNKHLTLVVREKH